MSEELALTGIKAINLLNCDDFPEENLFMAEFYNGNEEGTTEVIKCFKELIKKKLDINLIIIGNGELKKKYLAEINRLNLESRVKLVSYQKNISILLI